MKALEALGVRGVHRVLILIHWEGRRWLPAAWSTDKGSLLVTRPTGEEHATTAVRLLRDFK
eukprot:3048020-Rhodomonas_salina.2